MAQPERTHGVACLLLGRYYSPGGIAIINRPIAARPCKQPLIVAYGAPIAYGAIKFTRPRLIRDGVALHSIHSLIGCHTVCGMPHAAMMAHR